MSQRPSLIDDADMPAAAGKAKAGGGGLNPQTLKIIGASVVLLGAVAVLGWGMGWFRGGPKPLDNNAQRRERLQEEVQQDAQIDAKSRVKNYESGG